ncbi:MAG TPA: hypothetical protein VF915_17100 [Reyranella sp.]
MLHRATLALVAETLADAEDDWWLVGGAAVALQGLAIAIADIDVLMSRRDVVRVIARLGIAPVEGVAIDRIRSEIWARWTAPPLAVDLMAGLQVRTGARWTRVTPGTRQAITVDGRLLYVPARPELIDILRLFGRPKDLERAEGLARIA